MEKRAPTFEIDKRLREIRQSLLDLPAHNRALNFRPIQTRTIRVVNEIPAEVYAGLVLKEQVMTLRARPAGTAAEGREGDEAASLFWRVPCGQAAESPADPSLQTPLESAALQQRLFKVSQQARTILDEQGYTALHLALGFLEWADETPTARRAPLILIPVELERAHAGAAYGLRWTKEDAGTNISLQAMLLEQSVVLPDFEMSDDKAGVDRYLESVALAVSGKRGWRVTTDIYLDLFSFKKFALYKDLDPAAWPAGSSPADHPLVRAMLTPSRDIEKPCLDTRESDDDLAVDHLYTVLDADSSQAAVIAAARRGANLVVEGPPGTGKSQTIVNLIAELMAGGKTVLFVSEKMAALQAVKERLKEVGLGDFCLDLHSRKADRRDVLAELEASATRRPPLATRAAIDHNEYESLKAELNGYARALRAPCGKMQLSVFALYCLQERARRHFAAAGRTMLRFKLVDAEGCDQQQWSDALAKLSALGQTLAAIRPLATHPWRGCDPEAVMPSDESEIALLIARCRADLEHLLACVKRLEATVAMPPIANLEQTAEVLKAAKLIAFTKDEDTAGLLAEYEHLSAKRLRLFLPRYHRLKRAVAEVEQVAATVNDAARRFKRARGALSERLRINDVEIFGATADRVSFSALAARLDIWRSEVASLRSWAQYRTLVKGSLKMIAAPLLASIAADQIEPEDVVECFKANFADELLRAAFNTRPELAGFAGDLHDSKVARFAELDRCLIQANRQRLAEHLYAARSPSLGQFAWQRGLMPIRELMSRAGAFIQRCKPCFMMSPLSVARFLDPTGLRFDVVIFDEAGQVKTEAALGALLRGSQCIVVGDTHQLPPTSFFDSLIESGEFNRADARGIAGDAEGFLHQCKRAFDVRTLYRHYRSQHESLIAVSNREFYDDELAVYPSPERRPEWLGLHFVHLPQTVYDAGRTAVNRQEARAVAEAALEHYRQHPHQSLGIGTFDIAQQQAILEEIESHRRRHPEMEAHFKADRAEAFFVKSLETIQGDERDVILLSVGFGFDAERRLSLDSGALNQPGGERGLNVLVTRARKRCVVFANFRAADLAVGANAPAGLRVLKAFLEYAETRTLRPPGYDVAGSGGEVEDAAYEFIKRNGYAAHRRVGCGRLRLNLAIVDPRCAGRYLLGIECDDETFYTSPEARDRDRLRPQLLAARGWNLHRLWSTDWHRHRAEGERRLLEALRQAQEPRHTAVTAWAAPARSGPLQLNTTSRPAEVLRRAGFDPRRLEEIVAFYQTCSSLTIPVDGELHEQPVERLAEAVTHVVAIEGPVHLDEAIRRIRSLWGVKRAGQRIQQAINRAVCFAELNGGVQRRGAFLWPAAEHEVAVRRRQGDPPPRIEMICDEEIAAAVRLVLEHHLATAFDDLVIQCSRLFGIRGISGLAATRIRGMVMRLIESGQVQRTADGRIRLAQTP